MKNIKKFLMSLVIILASMLMLVTPVTSNAATKKTAKKTTTKKTTKKTSSKKTKKSVKITKLADGLYYTAGPFKPSYVDQISRFEYAYINGNNLTIKGALMKETKTGYSKPLSYKKRTFNMSKKCKTRGGDKNIPAFTWSKKQFNSHFSAKNQGKWSVGLILHVNKGKITEIDMA